MLYLMPALVGAAIGAFTNWLAIKMMFRPRMPVYILGRRLPLTPGVFIARRREFAKAVAEAAELEFAGEEHLVEVVLRANDDGKIWSTLRNTGLAPVWIMYCKTFGRAELSKHVAETSGWAKQNGLVKKLVAERINAMDISEIEEMVISVAEQELRSLTVAGAVLGFLVGSVQPLVSRTVEVVLAWG